MNTEALFGTEAVDVCRKLTGAGHQAFFVGGCVRDAALGLPAKDVDIVTDATPDQVFAMFPDSDLVGASFGVVRVKRGESAFEVATFRKDGEYSDGRRPDSVEYGSFDDDAARRDFTINSMYMDINGQVMDPNGGMRDLNDRCIRCVGRPELRFSEDKLRMLRAIRFAARFDFTIEPETEEAIRDRAEDIAVVSEERVRDELAGILRARSGFDRLCDSGLLRHVLPEVAAMADVPQDPVHHPEGDVLKHTRLVLSKLDRRDSDELLWAAMLHDVGKNYTTEIKDGRITAHGHAGFGANIARGMLSQLRFSTEFIECVAHIVGRHMMFIECDKWKQSTRRRFLASPTIELELALHRADCLGSNGYLGYWKKVSAWLELAKESRQVELPKPFVTGHDLIDLGFVGGPAMGVALKELMDMQLEGEIRSKEDGILLVQKLNAHDTDDLASRLRARLQQV